MKDGHPKIAKQVQLPLRMAAQIAWRSLWARLTRSLLTLITIVMAIAFLTYTWAGAVCEPAIRAAWLAAQGISDVSAYQRPPRTGWLISLSLLVCLVGISNAMLMSVMERFREIGTMKCLGALDSFILKLFLLESAFLGAAGTLLGILVGLILTLLFQWHHFGSAVWTAMPWGRLPTVCLGSCGIGLGITTAAALYPAWQAARMEPIAALRMDL